MACDSPVQIFSKGQYIPVPCGKCAPCKIRRVNEWVFRIMWEEENNSTSSHFVTLTYDTLHVPLTDNGFMTLRKRDLQLFFKRLRKLCPDFVLKYYACGEYGSKTQRPHYHAIILNVPDSEMFVKAWSLDGVQLGMVDVGTCTGDSVAYCLKYIDKQTGSYRSMRHARDDREREFPLMSKGIGKGYVDSKANQMYHKLDMSRNYVTKRGGYKVAMPRYYRLKLFDEFELEGQRQIIDERMQIIDEKERYIFGDERKGLTFMETKEAEKEGRRVKFEASKKKRSKL